VKVLLMSSSDREGGAARAAYRLHQGLQQIDVASQMLVQAKSSSDKTVLAPKTRLAQGIARARLTLDALPLKRYPHRDDTTFSVQWLPTKVIKQVTQLDPDVVNLHWVNDAYLPIEAIAQFHRPVVWSLHDMWAFTGGCHYTGECDRYLTNCGSCPQLHSQQPSDLSHRVWQRKAKAWKSANLTIVGLSTWLAKCAEASPLFQNRRVELIPNGLDTRQYRPLNRQFARAVLQLPQDKPLALFGAVAATQDQRKGFHLLQAALQDLSRSGWHDRLELVVFGSTRPDQPPDFGLPVHYLGNFSDDLSLALIYAAADVFILPSTQENLANTVMESLACGTPCVAFNIGGNPDMIEHQHNGYLAKPYQTEDLAQGIAWVVENPARHQNLCQRARQKVEQEFTLEIQARRYRSLFTELSQSTASPLYPVGR
jgi:glycosyltransferase involved in cell wall biosynthesis